jgi:DNA-binding IclR family transcriptional regulator
MLATDTTAEPQYDKGLASVDLVVALIEMLAASRLPRGVSDIARAVGTSKPRVHRHLRALLDRGYVRQDPSSDRYEIGIKLLMLGESVRDRFDVLAAARGEMTRLREASGQAVTLASFADDKVTILEMIQGRTLIEFGIRAGATLDLHASAHGLVTLARGPERLLRLILSRRRTAWTPHTITTAKNLEAEIARVAERGWATACDQVLVGVNALAAPILDHKGALCGTIEALPDQRQIALVTGAARRISASLGASL